VKRLLRWLSPAVALGLFAAAVWVLQRELGGVRVGEVRAMVGALPRSALAWALVLCAANYLMMTGFDLLAFRYVRCTVAAWKVAVASVTGYAVSNTVGFALISGTSVRYRFYTRWGLSAGDISRVVLFNTWTYWLGILVLGGWSLALNPLPGLGELPGGRWLPPLGWLLLAISVAYAVGAAVRRTPVRLGGFELHPPGTGLIAGQFAVSIADWALGSSIFYVLLPRGDLPFGEFLAAYLAAQILGQISHVPGGAGVFEGTMVVLLRGTLTAEEIVSSLVLYRIVYYVLPLAGALLVLVGDEVRQRRHLFNRFGALADEVAPKVLGAFVFAAGAVLLLSGALPAERPRVEILRGWLPQVALEAGHLAGALAGAGLLLVSHAVARRLESGFRLASLLLLAGVAAALLRGGDYREAVLLALLLAPLLPSRTVFHRRAPFWSSRLSPWWQVMVGTTLAFSIWLGTFTHRSADLSLALLWSTGEGNDAGRFLRAAVGASAILGVFFVLRLLRRVPDPAPRPSPADFAALARPIGAQEATLPFLAYVGDKSLLWDDGRRGFVPFSVAGGAWVALGDPVGPDAAHPTLVRDFLERADDFNAVPVFYQATEERLPLYREFGLTAVRLGDEALVPLDGFAMEDDEGFRAVLARLDAAGARFRVVPPAEVPPLLPALREVSDAWLREKRGGERAFSVGYFEPAYVARFPVAVLESGGRVLAFATVWPGPGGVELSADLVRHRPDAPEDAAEALLLRLMAWGRAAGYARFSLGVAPASTPELAQVAPVWTRLGHLALRRAGEAYDVQEMRTYKQRFSPVWEPRYLAYPAGVPFLRVLDDVAALVTGPRPAPAGDHAA
jgi:phosphatidylglycerol lysyltransferase